MPTISPKVIASAHQVAMGLLEATFDVVSDAQNIPPFNVCGRNVGKRGIRWKVRRRLAWMFLETLKQFGYKHKKSTRPPPDVSRLLRQVRSGPLSIAQTTQQHSLGVIHAIADKLDRELVAEEVLSVPIPTEERFARTLLPGGESAEAACCRIAKGIRQRVSLSKGDYLCLRGNAEFERDTAMDRLGPPAASVTNTDEDGLPASATGVCPAAPRLPDRNVCPVSLDETERTATVCGRNMHVSTQARCAVLRALIRAYPGSLTKDKLSRRAEKEDAVNVLKRLAKSDRDWGKVIHLAGETGGGYRLKWPK